MSADVYVLASSAPTLFVYPSTPHPIAPEPPPSNTGHGHRYPIQPNIQRDRLLEARRRRRDEDALAVLGAI